MKTVIIFLFLVLLLFGKQIHAQKIELGIESGFCKIGNLGNPINSAVDLSENDFFNYVKTGFIGYCNPDSAVLRIRSGVLFFIPAKNADPDNNVSELKLLQIPLGIDFRSGKTLYGLIGGGINFNYLIGKDKADIKYPEYMIGYYGNIGIGYRFNEKFDLDIKYQYGRDATPIYSARHYTHFESSVWDKEYTVNAGLSISFRYTLSR